MGSQADGPLLVDLVSGELTSLGVTPAVLDAVWSPDGRHLASTGWDLRLRAWERGADEALTAVDEVHGRGLARVWWPRDDLLVSAGDQPSIVFRDLGLHDVLSAGSEALRRRSLGEELDADDLAAVDAALRARGLR